MGTKTQKLSNIVDQIVEWQSVFTGDGSTGLTAVAGRGYFIDTTSGTVTVTLPASPKAGDIVQLKDYARTWGTNNVTTASALFDGISRTQSFSTDGQTVTLVYMDGTKGWSLINEDTTTGLGAGFISATGGTVTTSGDYKIHSFTGDGCFVVSCGGNPAGSDTVDYLVIAGGASGGGYGGAGAGGFRESHSTPVSGCYTASPLATPTGITVSATTYPVTVGAGGASKAADTNSGAGYPGSNSVFSTITSTGGGAGTGGSNPGDTGGSGGGGSYCGNGGAGNTPPVSPPQGNSGGSGGRSCISAPNYLGGGGGGAGAVGTTATPSGAPGGNGATTSISGSSTTYAGGGGGGAYPPMPDTTPTGGSGGGGSGGYGDGPGPVRLGTAGSANTGGGGGASPPNADSGAGGKGIVILRYKFQ
jgi:hypothetical protein